eukprot:2119635-Pleurochrysis_carterae.AAC.4
MNQSNFASKSNYLWRMHSQHTHAIPMVLCADTCACRKTGAFDSIRTSLRILTTSRRSISAVSAREPRNPGHPVSTGKMSKVVHSQVRASMGAASSDMRAQHLI